MANYRGGDRRESIYGQRAIQRIEAGQTERQRQRNFNQKLIMAGVQAALQLTRGGIEMKRHADMNQERIDKLAAKKAAHEAKAPPPDYKPMAAGPNDASVPSWLSGDPNGPNSFTAWPGDPRNQVSEPSGAVANPYNTTEMMDKANEALASNDYDDDDVKTIRGGRGMMGSQ